MKQLTILILLLHINYLSFAQTSLFGKITDKETGEELIGANVVVEQNDIFIAGTTTDFNGIYKIDLDPGNYNFKVTMIGYPESLIIGVIVKTDLENKLDVQLDAGLLLIICCFGPTYYDPPLIQLDNTTSGSSIKSRNIQRSPFRDTHDLILNAAGVSSAQY